MIQLFFFQLLKVLMEKICMQMHYQGSLHFKMAKKQTRNRMTPSLDVLMKSLKPFFENNFAEFTISEYARIYKIQRNQATTILSQLQKDNFR